MVVSVIAASDEPPLAQFPIPNPEEIERRLYSLKLETGLLRRLLRISRDRQILAKRHVDQREGTHAAR
ncbi:MAG: hypothetical protein U0792_22800 [Gemmataceae bacterium]